VRGLGADDVIDCRWDASPFPSEAIKAIPHLEENLNMPRIAVPTRDEAPAESQPILDSVGVQLGFIPNLHRLMSLSPAALTGFIGLQGALSKTLDLRTRHAISLAVSEANACNYCLAAHSYRAARFAHESPEEIALNRQGRSSDPKRGAAAGFAKSLIESRGRVRDSDLASMREAGFTDGQIIEVIALSAQFLMTNFMNNVADTEIDFPEFEPAQAG
jgi:uncharacterized peroxidase-related enzyme